MPKTLRYTPLTSRTKIAINAPDPGEMDLLSMDFLKTFGSNLPKSTLSVLADIVNVPKALVTLGMESDDPLDAVNKVGRGIAASMDERYGLSKAASGDLSGAWTAAKRTLGKDPAGFALDISPLTGMAAKGLGGLSKVAEAAGQTQKLRTLRGFAQAADLANPVKAVGRIGEKLVQAPKTGARLVGSAFSGVDPEVITQATKKAVYGTSTEREALRTANKGLTPIGDVEDGIQRTVDAVRMNRKTTWDMNKQALNLPSITYNPSQYTQAVFNSIRGMLRRDYGIKTTNLGKVDVSQSGGFAAKSVEKASRNTIEKLLAEVRRGTEQPNLDWLHKVRERVDATIDLIPDNKPQLQSAGAKIRSIVSDYAGSLGGPEWKKLNKTYSEQTNFLRDLERILKTQSDSAAKIKALTGVLNENTRVARTVVQQAEELSGVPLTAMAAGMGLSQTGAQGLVGRSAMIGSLRSLSPLAMLSGAAMGNPLLALGGLAALPLTSPRFIGGTINAMGVAAHAPGVQRGLKTLKGLSANPRARGLAQAGLTGVGLTNRYGGQQ